MTQPPNFSPFEKSLMGTLIEKAAHYKGCTHPNPCVAAAIYKGKDIIAIGVHQKKGSDHAEIDALKKAGPQAKGSQMMVTLEPCTHYGSTGPCTEAIIEAGISSIIYASADCFSAVKNNPAKQRLEKAGITVRSGLLENEAITLNHDYYYSHTHKKPYVILKAATSADGHIALKNGESKYMSCQESLTEVHRIRSNVNAIVVGRQTLEQDNPKLTIRHVPIKDNQVLPTLIVFANTLQKNKHYNIFDSSYPTILVTNNENYSSGTPFDDVWIINRQSNKHFWDIFLQRCYEASIYSLLLEGGSTLYSKALEAAIVNKINIFITPKLIGTNNGIPLCSLPAQKTLNDALALKKPQYQQFGKDLLISAQIKH